MDEDFKKAIEFHGHMCPGLAMGYRVARYVREHCLRSRDEERVCTAGKGNLIINDHGKQAFTIYSREKGYELCNSCDDLDGCNRFEWWKEHGQEAEEKLKENRGLSSEEYIKKMGSSF